MIGFDNRQMTIKVLSLNDEAVPTMMVDTPLPHKVEERELQ